MLNLLTNLIDVSCLFGFAVELFAPELSGTVTEMTDSQPQWLISVYLGLIVLAVVSVKLTQLLIEIRKYKDQKKREEEEKDSEE